jgi:hypothetical protein
MKVMDLWLKIAISVSNQRDKSQFDASLGGSPEVIIDKC